MERRASATAEAQPVADVFAEDDVTVVEVSFDSLKKQIRRPSDEPLERSLARLAATLKKAKVPAGEVAVVDAAGEPLPPETPAGAAWRELGAAVRINGVDVPLRRDALRLGSVSAVRVPIEGVALVPTLGFSHADHAALLTDPETQVSWRWTDADTGAELGRERAFTPLAEHVGTRLAVEAEAVTGAVSLTLEEPVERADARGPARSRVAGLGPAPTGEAFRVMSYNVLADAYRHTWPGLFPYLDSKVAWPDRRLQLALQDVIDADADIVCMQECDSSWYERLYEPVLGRLGYNGVHTVKTGKTAEGCALFVRDRFRVARSRDVDLTALAIEDPELAPFLGAHPELVEVFEKITTVAQLALLEPAGGADENSVVVANTHLFFHPNAVHVRIIQSFLLLREARRFIDEHAPGAALVFCGDLNGEPFDGVIEFVRDGGISAAHAEWARGSFFRWGGVSSRAKAAELLDPSSAEPTLAPSGPAGARRRRIERLQVMRTCIRCALDPPEGACRVGASAGDGDAYEAVKEHCRKGCTFKTCAAVAAFTLRRDVGLADGLTLEADAEIAEAAAARLAAEVEADVATAVEEQRALAGEAPWAPGEAAALEAAGCGLHLAHAFELTSACGFPEYTNYVQGFKGCLDYIWADARALAVQQHMPMPSHDDVVAETALPSSVFPSDHLPMVADLRFISTPRS